MSRVVSFIVLVAILLVIGGLFFEVMAGFFLPLFLAVLLVIVFRPVHDWIAGRCRGRTRLAAGLTTLAILAIVLVPMLLILLQAAIEAGSIAAHWDAEALKHKLAALREDLGLELPPAPLEDRLDQLDEAVDELPRADAADAGRLAQGAVEAAAEVRRGLGLDDEPRAAAPPGWAHCRHWETLSEHVSAVEGAARRLQATPPVDDEFSRLVSALSAAVTQLNYDLVGGPLRARLKRQLHPSELQLAELRDRAKEFADSLALGGAKYAGNVVLDFLVGLGVMILALYYFLADGPAMVKAFMRLSPLDDRYEEQLFKEFTTVSRAVVVATLLSAIVQGLLAGPAYFLAGLGSVALLTMLTMLFALIPFIGATAIWLPCCLWLFLEGRTAAALALAVYCLVVVSMADNVIKPLVLQGKSNLHPLLALLSVLGGVKAMGPIGIVVGPMVVAFLQALLNMLQVEIEALSGQTGHRG